MANREKEIREIKNQIDDLSEQLMSLGGENADEVSKGVTEAYQRLRDKSLQALEKTKKASKDAKEYLEENPWQAIGVAVLTGFVLGMFVGRKR